MRILMIGNNREYLSLDGALLRDKGFNIYLCDNARIMDEMIAEVKPDLIFINWQTPDLVSTETYHSLLDNIRYACTPVVYTLSEDDVYLVNKKRTTLKERRYITSDNIIDAIKIALVNTASITKKQLQLAKAPFYHIPFAYRA